MTTSKCHPNNQLPTNIIVADMSVGACLIPSDINVTIELNTIGKPLISKNPYITITIKSVIATTLLLTEASQKDD